MRALVSVLVALSCTSLVACSGKSSSANRAEEQLAALQKKKEADAKAKKDKEDHPVALPTEVIKLDPPYDDTQATVIMPDGPCPDGLWALFGGDAPGATPEEKKANAAKRKEVAEAAKAKKYLVKLRGAQQVKLSEYDAPNGKFTIEVAGTVDCTDSIGRIAIAWTAAKAGDPGNSAAKADADFAQNVWMAEPVKGELNIKSLTEAKDFANANKFNLFARVGFTLGKAEVDKKVRKVAKVQEKVAAANETLTFGGGQEDWGAGRLVHAEVLGVRVAGDREKKMLFEKTK